MFIFQVIQNTVHSDEIDEQGGCDSLVDIAEGMILYDKIKEVDPLLLNARIEFLSAEGLIDGS